MTTPESGRRERKKEETRKRIVDCATELFEKKGFDNVTMEQIAEAADVARGTLYNYFPVREAILGQLVQAFAQDSRSEVERIIRSSPDTRSRLVALLRHHARWSEKRKDLMERYISHRMSVPLRSVRSRDARSGFDDHMIRILGLGQEAGEIRRDLAASILSGYLTSVYMWTYYGWLKESDAMDLDRAVERAVDLFLYGSAAKKQREGRNAKR